MSQSDWGDETEKYFTPAKSGVETILSSLTKIKYQSLAHLVKHTNLSIDEIAHHLLNDDRISEQQAGTVTVCFLAENQPEGKLYLTGGNFAVAGKNQNTEDMNTRIDIDEQKLEELAAQGLPQSKIAKELGVSAATLSNKINKRTSVREAYERGVETFNSSAPKRDFEPTHEEVIQPERKPEPTGIAVLAQSISRKEIELAGGRFMLGFAGNVWDLDARSFDFVQKINTLTQEFEAQQ